MYQLLERLFFHITVDWPRHLPRNEAEVNKLKQVLITHFGLKDEPSHWIAIFGQMCSVKPTSVRKPYRHYVNVAKRMEINKLANDSKMLEIEKLHVKLEAKLKEQANNVPEAPHDIPSELYVMPRTQDELVQPSGEHGI